MSKLESFIRRMTAQRDCLNHSSKLIKDLPGLIFELGLGNGRTYDHLRRLFPDREIYVFDRRVASFESCTPPMDHMFVGEAVDTLTKALELFGKNVAMIHNDLGTSSAEDNEALINEIKPLLESLMLPGGIIASNIEFHTDRWKKIPEPPGVKPGRYFLYKAV